MYKQYEPGSLVAARVFEQEYIETVSEAPQPEITSEEEATRPTSIWMPEPLPSFEAYFDELTALKTGDVTHPLNELFKLPRYTETIEIVTPYKVQSGEQWKKISIKFKVSDERLWELNEQTFKNLPKDEEGHPYLFTDLEIRVPKKSTVYGMDSILKNAKTMFNRTEGKYVDFYKILFDQLSEHMLSKINGDEATYLLMIHVKARKMFPLYANLSFAEQYEILMRVHQKVRSPRDFKSYAMTFFNEISDRDLDREVVITYREHVGDTDRDITYTYSMTYKNLKYLVDADTGKKVTNELRPQYCNFVYLNENNRRVKQSFLACDIWTILSNMKSYERKSDYYITKI